MPLDPSRFKTTAFSRGMIFVWLPLIFGLLVTGLVAWIVRTNDLNKVDATFQANANNIQNGLNENLDLQLSSVRAVAVLFELNPDTQSNEFDRFAERTLHHQTGIQAIEWVPIVDSMNRPRIEKQLSENYSGPFAFKKWTPESSWVNSSADWADEYFPVYYVFPLAGNESAVGIDLGSNPDRRNAIEKARVRKRLTVTRPILLAQSQRTNEGAVLALFPAYRDWPQSESNEILGFGLAVMRLDRLIESVLENRDTSGIQLRILDVDEAGTTDTIFKTSGFVAPSDTRWSTSFQREVGGRAWTFEWSFTEERIRDELSWNPWWALLFGSLLFVSIAYANFIVVNQKQMVQMEVEKRTTELNFANQEMEQLVYAASHDLKQPLRGIDQLIEFIRQDTDPQQIRSIDGHLHKIQNRANRMESMLSDILEYSKSGELAHELECIDLDAMIEMISESINVSGSFEITYDQSIRNIESYRVPLEQVFRNLIGNAIKHHHRGSGKIEIRSWWEKELAWFSVSDDGPGIDPDFRDQVFQMFQTLKPRDTVEGSGIGLAIVRKRIESVGGTIQLESPPGKGCTFIFSWPANRSAP